MVNASEWGRRFEEWTTSLPSDVQATWELLTNDSVAPAGRRWLAASLFYTLTQLDLIPDHERAGSIDDAFVLRVAYGLAAEHAGKTGREDAARIARMTHDEDALRELLGSAVYAKLVNHVMALAEKPVRGRTVDQLLAADGDKLRADLKRELDQQCKKMKPAQVANAADAEALVLTVQSYLKMKLGA
jgi:uncharacterized membrane protein YkvA (DUF1232 family)